MRFLLSCGNMLILLETRVFIFTIIFESPQRSQEVPDVWKMTNIPQLFK